MTWLLRRQKLAGAFDVGCDSFNDETGFDGEVFGGEKNVRISISPHLVWVSGELTEPDLLDYVKMFDE